MAGSKAAPRRDTLNPRTLTLLLLAGIAALAYFQRREPLVQQEVGERDGDHGEEAAEDGDEAQQPDERDNPPRAADV